ncbi:MAG: hypothetical protein ACREPF_12350, partial [Rhodanobacteraceae bacterium]
INQQENELAAIELKRSEILLQLMKEELRLKQMLGASPAVVPMNAKNNHDAAFDNVERQRQANEEAIANAQHLRAAKEHP